MNITYTDDLGFINSHEKVIEATDKCITDGLTGVPQDGELDMTYTISSYTKVINFPSISNGECDLDISVASFDGRTTLNYGLSFFPLVTGAYTDISIERFNVLSDARLTLFFKDHSFDG